MGFIDYRCISGVDQRKLRLAVALVRQRPHITREELANAMQLERKAAGGYWLLVAKEQIAFEESGQLSIYGTRG